MRISFILSTLWLSGGVRDIVEYANGLAGRGHQVSLVAPSGTLDSGIVPEISPQVRLLPTPVALPAEPKKASMLKLAQVSWSLAQTTPPSDVVISTHTPTTIAGWLATRVLRRGRPVWFYQDYVEMFEGRPVETWLARNAMRWHERALVLSTSSKEELNSYFPCDVRVVWVGLSHMEYFKPLPAAERPATKGRQNVLFLGDMRPRKGWYDFLEAAALVNQSLPNVHFWIVSKEECQVDSRVSHEYIYRPSRKELARLFGLCDAFVSASWWESFGIPPLEAMACAAPVVLTDSRGVRDFANHGENCLMTPPRDPQALADAIITVLTDPQLTARLRRNGPPTAARFTWETATDRFEAGLADLA